MTQINSKALMLVKRKQIVGSNHIFLEIGLDIGQWSVKIGTVNTIIIIIHAQKRGVLVNRIVLLPRMLCQSALTLGQDDTISALLGPRDGRSAQPSRPLTQNIQVKLLVLPVLHGHDGLACPTALLVLC